MGHKHDNVLSTQMVGKGFLERLQPAVHISHSLAALRRFDGARTQQTWDSISTLFGGSMMAAIGVK